jgi:hypothetical protein
LSDRNRKGTSLPTSRTGTCFRSTLEHRGTTRPKELQPTTIQKVKAHYKNLRAYADDITSMALGDRPVIYWVDSDRGIAFEFAYFQEEQRRYLYSVIVFRPNGLFCPMGEKIEPSHWHEILPYSLELPDRSAHLRSH